jgi:hypothetical protein
VIRNRGARVKAVVHRVGHAASRPRV